MKMKWITTIAVCATMMLLTSQSSSTTVYLNDGKIIDAKIVERSSDYIIIETGHKIKKYYMSQIEYIEEDEPEAPNDYVPVDLSQYEGIAEDKVRLIFNYIEVSGVRSTMIQNIKQTIDQVPEDQKEKYEKMFNVNEIIERLIPVYSKYYSKLDLVNMIQFYGSPTGRKVLESTPEIMKEAVSVSVQYIKEQATPRD